MTLDDLKTDLSERLGMRVSEIYTRDGDPVFEMTDLYQASPAGFGGQLKILNGSRYAWELWVESEATWNFQSTPIIQ